MEGTFWALILDSMTYIKGETLSEEDRPTFLIQVSKLTTKLHPHPSYF